MKAILVEPYGKAKVLEIENELENFQDLVGGWIETAHNQDYVYIVNEEGLLMRLPQNIYGFVGNIVIVRDDGEDFRSLNDKDIEIILADIEKERER